MTRLLMTPEFRPRVFRRFTDVVMELLDPGRRTRFARIENLTLLSPSVSGLVENYGVGVTEIARQVGISTSGVSKILNIGFCPSSQQRPLVTLSQVDHE